MHNFLEDDQDIPKIQFDLPQQFTINTRMDGTGIVGDNNSSSCTFRTGTSAKRVLDLPPTKENNPSPPPATYQPKKL